MLGIRGYGIYCRFYGRKAPTIRERDIWDKNPLFGLCFLHKNGITHADLQPGNLLFAVSEINSLSEVELQQDQSCQDQDTTPELLKRRDGKEDQWAPRHLFLGQSLYKYIRFGPEMVVKISDFGAAFWTQDPPKSTVTPVALRAPELIFGEKITSSIDIWSFGCLIYEFQTGTPLFCVAKYGDDEDDETDDDHSLELNDVLNPLPDSWLKEKWPRANKYFGPNRERLFLANDAGDRGDDEAGKSLETQGDEVSSEVVDEDYESYKAEYGDGPWINSPLEVLFKQNKPEDIDEEEADVVTSLIRTILKYEPSERPSAAELLEHPWFQE